MYTYAIACRVSERVTCLQVQVDEIKLLDLMMTGQGENEESRGGENKESRGGENE